ncbi:hypothetical protein O4215_20625 [Rhodococcus maanshanensis]|uniref:hypothetical protein n=1 Tax=Rhodococcus maanshanensis TaxID=183556 RepID=UPI0022B2EF86|nr:hypothetical protein [Rhodococcus maanshanensis]MCZ4557970.1 hypothetical protein [Rhodococcus maanshanensis]
MSAPAYTPDPMDLPDPDDYLRVPDPAAAPAHETGGLLRMSRRGLTPAQARDLLGLSMGAVIDELSAAVEAEVDADHDGRAIHDPDLTDLTDPEGNTAP